ncbi:glycosyltransferase [Limnospira fusiformis]|uniref:glycosyltransferase n=1 Tax=Limnospira fusiformis TaxID=54297 RepID=UPI001449635A|nr:hypothetical protein HFV01_27520 [Limnospira fusiformis SAG 85.79]
MELRVKDILSKSEYACPDVMYYVATRFNLWSPNRGRKLGDANWQKKYEDWCVDRMEELKNICFPSLIKQKIMPHKWLILFDEVPVKKIHEQILRLEDKYDFIKIVFVSRPYGFENFQPILSQELKLITPKDKLICTTRLDSDDSLNTYYFSLLDEVISILRKDNSSISLPICINFLFGFLRNLINNECVVFLNECNPMYSLLEENNSTLMTPYYGIHKKIDRIVKTINISTDRPMWLQNNTENNITTRGYSHLIKVDNFDNYKNLFGFR